MSIKLTLVSRDGTKNVFYCRNMLEAADIAEKFRGLYEEMTAQTVNASEIRQGKAEKTDG